MTTGTIIYLIFLMLSALIAIFFTTYSTVALIGMMIFVPAIMFVMLIFQRLRVSVSVDAKNPLAEKDDIDKPARAAITMSVENANKILPITKGIAKVKYENTFSGEKGKMKVRFSVDANKKRDRRILVPMNDCGNLAITVEKVRIYDYLSIFAWTIGRDFETQNILVLPPVREMYLSRDKWYNETTEDSDRFSIYKKGDDPSEIFDIREFNDGDKIQRIHWKLSSKVGSLMVKEGSLPLTKNINIIIDLCVQGNEKNVKRNTNLLVQGIYSISMYMIEKKIPQNFIWYDKKNDIIQEKMVEQEEELIWMFQELFKSKITDQEDEFLNAYIAWEGGRLLESAMYLTVCDHGNIESAGIVKDRLEIMDLRQVERQDEEQ